LAKDFTDGKDELVRVCYDWQINNVQYDSWAKKLEKKLNKIGLGHIWQNELRIRTAQRVKKLNRDVMISNNKMFSHI
jgi:hypothetical protein